MKISQYALIAFFLVGCAHMATAPAFDRPDLFALVPAAEQAGVRGADRHILVVRHARKIAPECNALNCPLSETGVQMVAKLHTLIGNTPVDVAYASAACRTRDTARAGGITVQLHRAADRMARGCEDGQNIDRRRHDAFADARNGHARWSIVGEHSNTVCQWLENFVGEDAAGAGCVKGRLPSNAYGAIYWLYRAGGTWKLLTLDGVFDVAEG